MFVRSLWSFRRWHVGKIYSPKAILESSRKRHRLATELFKKRQIHPHQTHFSNEGWTFGEGGRNMITSSDNTYGLVTNYYLILFSWLILNPETGKAFEPCRRKIRYCWIPLMQPRYKLKYSKLQIRRKILMMVKGFQNWKILGWSRFILVINSNKSRQKLTA